VLDESTWPDFAKLVERNNGVWGGCWCMGFHEEAFGAKPHSVARNKANKKQRVKEGRAHAALVYDGAKAVGWCQFGPTDELPRIKHKKEYASGITKLPDWRITCFFVDKDYKRRGVAETALKGAVEAIARLGGGMVESYPEDVRGRRTSGSFLYNATLSTFERQGFKRERRLGKNHWVVSKRVRASKAGR
jgi:GNAT superfamily N-acetyltransferase